jgi:hypothetical protein
VAGLHKVGGDVSNADVDDFRDGNVWEEDACRCCGCTDSEACPGGCYWIESDLCSSCARPVENVLIGGEVL